MKPLAALLALALTAGCTTSQEPVLRTADPSAQSGGMLRIAVTAPGGVDPGNAYEPVSELIARTMCTPLLGTDPETGQVVPGIVESWLVSDSGTSLSLRLRDDVVFSDGTELTAADVAFTLSRVASADFASTAADRLAPIDGYAELHGDVPTDDDLERRRLRGVEVRDDDDVQIALTEPLADFVRVLTSPLTSPVSEAAVRADPDGFARDPVCVGPYVLDEPYVPGSDRVRLVRSPHHEPVDTARTRAGASYAERVEFVVVDDPAVAFAEGRADVAPAGAVSTPAVQSGPGPFIEYLGIPTGADGFSDPRVRRALALAIDREELVRRVFPGTRVPADGFLPPTSELDDACEALPARGDPAAARALLAEAAVDLSDARVPLAFNDELRNGELVAEVARQLEQALGLTVVAQPMTYDQFLATGSGSQGFRSLFRFSWSLPWSDVDGYLHPLFSSDRIGRDNLSRFSDPDVDRTLDRVAREAEEPADRELGYGRVAELLCERMPMVPLTTSLSRWLVADRVASATGEVVDGSTGALMVRELFLQD